MCCVVWSAPEPCTPACVGTTHALQSGCVLPFLLSEDGEKLVDQLWVVLAVGDEVLDQLLLEQFLLCDLHITCGMV